MSIPQIPTGAKLDALVVWAVGYYNTEAGFTGSADLIAIIGSKVGFDPQMMVGDHDSRNVMKSLTRVKQAGLIIFDSGRGYRLAKLP